MIVVFKNVMKDRSLIEILVLFILVETSRTCLDEGDAPAPARKVIKPDLSLLMSNSFDDVSTM